MTTSLIRFDWAVQYTTSLGESRLRLTETVVLAISRDFLQADGNHATSQFLFPSAIFFLCLSCSPFFTRQVLIANTQNMKWVVHILSIESSQCVLCTSVRFCEGTSLPLNWNPFLKTRNPPFKSRSSAHFLFEFFIFERIFE